MSTPPSSEVQREAMRQNLLQIWRRVPAWIGSASVQQVREYKKTHAVITKLLAKSNLSQSELMGAHSQTLSIYK